MSTNGTEQGVKSPLLNVSSAVSSSFIRYDTQSFSIPHDDNSLNPSSSLSVSSSFHGIVGASVSQISDNNSSTTVRTPLSSAPFVQKFAVVCAFIASSLLWGCAFLFISK